MLFLVQSCGRALLESSGEGQGPENVKNTKKNAKGLALLVPGLYKPTYFTALLVPELYNPTYFTVLLVPELYLSLPLPRPLDLGIPPWLPPGGRRRLKTQPGKGRKTYVNHRL